MAEQESCPICTTKYDNGMFRKVYENCGHVYCRECFLKGDDGCRQCKDGIQFSEVIFLDNYLNEEVGDSESRVLSGSQSSPTKDSSTVTASTLYHGGSHDSVAGPEPSTGPNPSVRTGSFVDRWRAEMYNDGQSKSPVKTVVLPGKGEEITPSAVPPVVLKRIATRGGKARGRVAARGGSASSRASVIVGRDEANAVATTSPNSSSTSSAQRSPPVLFPSVAARIRKTPVRYTVLGGVDLKRQRSVNGKDCDDVVSTSKDVNDRNEVSAPRAGPSSSTTSSEVSLPPKKKAYIDTSSSQERSPPQRNRASSELTSESSRDPLEMSADEEESSNAKKEAVRKKRKRNPVLIHDHITILSGDPQLYKCNVCLKKFKTKAHIKYHEFCQNVEKPFKCDQCGQGFIAKSHYEYHLRTHTGERPYVCPKCGKGFNQRGKVTRHLRSHTGEKPFICQQCGRGFANAQALRSHFLIHTGERPFACQYCNKRFTGMTNLKKHVITHTGERPFSCTHCGKSFGLKWTLDLHLRTHSTERPYACNQCTRAFSNSKDLRRHLVIHSGERPFKCWICGTAFRRKDNLDRHIKNTHNQPKEVAKQLANEAAADYMARQNQAKLLSNGHESNGHEANVIKMIEAKKSRMQRKTKSGVQGNQQPVATVLHEKQPMPAESGGEAQRTEADLQEEVIVSDVDTSSIESTGLRIDISRNEYTAEDDKVPTYSLQLVRSGTPNGEKDTDEELDPPDEGGSTQGTQPPEIQRPNYTVVIDNPSQIMPHQVSQQPGTSNQVQQSRGCTDSNKDVTQHKNFLLRTLQSRLLSEQLQHQFQLTNFSLQPGMSSGYVQLQQMSLEKPQVRLTPENLQQQPNNAQSQQTSNLPSSQQDFSTEQLSERNSLGQQRVSETDEVQQCDSSTQVCQGLQYGHAVVRIASGSVQQEHVQEDQTRKSPVVADSVSSSGPGVSTQTPNSDHGHDIVDGSEIILPSDLIKLLQRGVHPLQIGQHQNLRQLPSISAPGELCLPANSGIQANSSGNHVNPTEAAHMVNQTVVLVDYGRQPEVLVKQEIVLPTMEEVLGNNYLETGAGSTEFQDQQVDPNTLPNIKRLPPKFVHEAVGTDDQDFTNCQVEAEFMPPATTKTAEPIRVNMATMTDFDEVQSPIEQQDFGTQAGPSYVKLPAKVSMIVPRNDRRTRLSSETPQIVNFYSITEEGQSSGGMNRNNISQNEVVSYVSSAPDYAPMRTAYVTANGNFNFANGANRVLLPRIGYTQVSSLGLKLWDPSFNLQ